MRIVLATSNPGKVREAHVILDGSPFEIIEVDSFIGDVETGAGYLENARLKAISLARVTDLAVLAEDSGLEVDALGGLPGPRSARFSGPGATDGRNNDKLLRLLEGTPEAERTARYRAVAVLVLRTGAELVGDGVWEGRIAPEPKGSGGFGYDPLFVPAGESRTAAELTREEKSAVSHRAQALRALAQRYSY